MPRAQVNHPVFARIYARLTPAMDRGGLEEHRRRLLSGLSGRVLEVGAGNGGNLAYYPPGVDAVLAVEPEPYLREHARRRAPGATVPVEVVDGTAESLPAGGDSVDAVVVSLVLCSVPDQVTALREIRRVLRPGGQLRFLEHVRAGGAGLQRVQRALDATVWPRVAGGCHTARDTAAAIEAAGFTMAEVTSVRFPEGRVPTPTSLHILGVATKPAH